MIEKGDNIDWNYRSNKRKQDFFKPWLYQYYCMDEKKKEARLKLNKNVTCYFE